MGFKCGDRTFAELVHLFATGYDREHEVPDVASSRNMLKRLKHRFDIFMRDVDRSEASHGTAGHKEICNLVRRRNRHVRKHAAAVGRNSVYAHCAFWTHRHTMTAVKALPILAFAHGWMSILEFKDGHRTVFHAFSASGTGDSHFDLHLFSPLLFMRL